MYVCLDPTECVPTLEQIYRLQLKRVVKPECIFNRGGRTYEDL
jgi:hypothetical protein